MFPIHVSIKEATGQNGTVKITIFIAADRPNWANAPPVAPRWPKSRIFNENNHVLPSVRSRAIPIVDPNSLPAPSPSKDAFISQGQSTGTDGGEHSSSMAWESSAPDWGVTPSAPRHASATHSISKVDSWSANGSSAPGQGYVHPSRQGNLYAMDTTSQKPSWEDNRSSEASTFSRKPRQDWNGYGRDQGGGGRFGAPLSGSNAIQVNPVRWKGSAASGTPQNDIPKQHALSSNQPSTTYSAHTFDMNSAQVLAPHEPPSGQNFEYIHPNRMNAVRTSTALQPSPPSPREPSGFAPWASGANSIQVTRKPPSEPASPSRWGQARADRQQSGPLSTYREAPREMTYQPSSYADAVSGHFQSNRNASEEIGWEDNTSPTWGVDDHASSNTANGHSLPSLATTHPPSPYENITERYSVSAAIEQRVPEPRLPMHDQRESQYARFYPEEDYGKTDQQASVPDVYPEPNFNDDEDPGVDDLWIPSSSSSTWGPSVPGDVSQQSPASLSYQSPTQPVHLGSRQSREYNRGSLHNDGSPYDQYNLTRPNEQTPTSRYREDKSEHLHSGHAIKVSRVHDLDILMLLLTISFEGIGSIKMGPCSIRSPACSMRIF